MRTLPPSPPLPPPVLDVLNVAKRYGDLVAVAGVSFQVQAGECYGLLGPNGAGKTTLFKLISGMVFPVSDLPGGLRQIAYALPLFHVTELNRLLLFGREACVEFVWVCPIYLVFVTSALVRSGLYVMERRIIQ